VGDWTDLKSIRPTDICTYFSYPLLGGMLGILQKPPAAVVYMNWILKLAGNLRKILTLKSRWRISDELTIICPLSIAQIAELMCLKSSIIVHFVEGNCSKGLGLNYYSLSYVIRMMPKRGYTPEGYFEYTVYPLEGLWDLTEKGRKLDRLNKDELLYTIMIRQSDFVTEEVVDKAFEIARKKEPHSLLDKVYFGTIEDGLSVQMLHIGPYDTEPQSFEMMKKFIEENNLEIKTLRHREIYLSDARKVEPAKLKTVLRYTVRRLS